MEKFVSGINIPDPQHCLYLSRRSGRVGNKLLVVLFLFEIRNILLTKIKTDPSVFQSFHGQ
jgi:hypothetical protein